jgi:cytochrome P450
VGEARAGFTGLFVEHAGASLLVALGDLCWRKEKGRPSARQVLRYAAFFPMGRPDYAAFDHVKVPVQFAGQFAIAGLDTVAAAIGFGLLHLARHPEDQKRLRDKPSVIPGAVEEMLRAFSTVQMIRKTTKDTELCVVKIKAGDLVCCPSMVANRDPEEYPDPDQIDFDRNANRHMAFAYGVHRCLGSHLARRELVTALEEWYKCIPAFRIKEGSPPVTYGGFVFGVDSLHLVWD